MKHLTVEMQKSLQGDGKNSSSPQLAAFDQIRAASSDFQVFETGQVLLSAIDPKSHEKFEVYVDSDDLSGTFDPDDVFTYTVTAGALPPGLVLNGSNGNIFGTPSAGGFYSFTLRATRSLARRRCSFTRHASAHGSVRRC